MDKIMKLISAGLLCVVFLQAQAPVKLVDGRGTAVGLGAPGTQYNSGMTDITTSGVTVTSVTTKVKIIWCRNDSGSAATVAVTDNSNEVYVPTQSMATKSVLLVVANDIGITMGGVKITAGANSAIKCQVEGAQ